MFTAMIYDKTSGRCTQRYICSSIKQLSAQEIPAGCEIFKGPSEDPNEFKVTGQGNQRALERLAEHEKGPIVR